MPSLPGLPLVSFESHSAMTSGLLLPLPEVSVKPPNFAASHIGSWSDCPPEAPKLKVADLAASVY